MGKAPPSPVRDIPAESTPAVVEAFHKLYYGAADRTWQNTYWLGASVLKCPLDLWVYQELMYELRPDVIVECGTAYGGSAFYLACLCDLLDHGSVVSIDVHDPGTRPRHPRMEFLQGSSVSDEVVRQVKEHTAGRRAILVLLDSDHSAGHVLDELRAYSALVSDGSYIVVEDSNVNGHPVLPEHGPGPMEAVTAFLAECDDFVIDDRREKYYMTFNPKGYLRRTNGNPPDPVAAPPRRAGRWPEGPARGADHLLARVLQEQRANEARLAQLEAEHAQLAAVYAEQTAWALSLEEALKRAPTYAEAAQPDRRSRPVRLARAGYRAARRYLTSTGERATPPSTRSHGRSDARRR